MKSFIKIKCYIQNVVAVHLNKKKVNFGYLYVFL